MNHRKQRHFYLHPLVAEAYIPNPNNLPQINHIDGDPSNNYFSNLEWCTAKQNIQHAYKTGLTPTNKNNGVSCPECGEPHSRLNGELCWFCKRKLKNKENRIAAINSTLTDVGKQFLSSRDQTILDMRVSGATLQEIGDKFGFSREYIRQRLSRINSGKAIKIDRIENHTVIMTRYRLQPTQCGDWR